MDCESVYGQCTLIMSTLQATRNGLRVGDLVGDFDVFTEK